MMFMTWSDPNRGTGTLAPFPAARPRDHRWGHNRDVSDLLEHFAPGEESIFLGIRRMGFHFDDESTRQVEDAL